MNRYSVFILALVPLMLGACGGSRTRCPDPGPPAVRPAVQMADRAPAHRIVEPALRRVLTEAGIDPDGLRCNTRVNWERSLDRYASAIVEGFVHYWKTKPDAEAMAKAHHHALGYLVRTYFNVVEPHNLGAMRLRGLTYRDEAGVEHPLLIFRSGMTVTFAGASDCFRDLVRKGEVRHVANLYGGTFPFEDMVAEEKKLAGELSVSYFDALADQSKRWRRLVEHEETYQQNLAEASRRLATLIRENLLQPGGKAPRGNLYIHCGGGMHRSGMLFGVLRRCINGESMARIEAEYKRHVDYKSPQRPGGFEALNLRFIKDFDCSLLTGEPPEQQ